MNKPVVVVYDTDGWAWHKRAMDLIEFAPPGFAVDMVSQSKVDHNRLRRSKVSVLYFSWFECPLARGVKAL